MKLKCIITLGITGSGKSVIGKQIAKEKGYTFLDKDTLTENLVDYILQQTPRSQVAQDRESDFYIQTVRPIAYKGLLKTVIENLKIGQNVVIAADFYSEISQSDYLSQNPYFAQIKQLADLYVVDITVDHPTLLKRLITRNEPRDSWKIANWNTYVKETASRSLQWSHQDFTHITYDNSDALPVLQELKFKNLLAHL